MKHLNDKENKALRLLKSKLEHIIPDYLEDIRLFGSKTRGTTSKFSDVDVLILLKGGSWRDYDPIYDAVTDVLMETGIDVSLRIITVDTAHKLRRSGSPFMVNVDKESVRV